MVTCADAGVVLGGAFCICKRGNRCNQSKARASWPTQTPQDRKRGRRPLSIYILLCVSYVEPAPQLYLPLRRRISALSARGMARRARAGCEKCPDVSPGNRSIFWGRFVPPGQVWRRRAGRGETGRREEGRAGRMKKRGTGRTGM